MATVFDGKDRASVNWTVEVIDVNMPPVLDLIRPPEGVVDASEGTDVGFSMAPSDPDGDELTIIWTIDGEIFSEGNSAIDMVLDHDSAGTHHVAVIISDGQLETRAEWTLVVSDVNRPPSIVLIEPDASGTINVSKSLTLRMVALDPDGETLEYTWSVNGAITDKGSLMTNRTFVLEDFSGPGNHIIKVMASDPRGGSVDHSWNISIPSIIVDPTPPNGTIDDIDAEGWRPTGPMLAAAVLFLIASMVAIVMIIRRIGHRKTAEEAGDP